MKGRDAKPHIGIFGRRNNGESSLINCLANQEVAIVSSEPGTTTDPVKKSMGVQPVENAPRTWISGVLLKTIY